MTDKLQDSRYFLPTANIFGIKRFLFIVSRYNENLKKTYRSYFVIVIFDPFCTKNMKKNSVKIKEYPMLDYFMIKM